MSIRKKLHSEYFKNHGTRRGRGNFKDDYVRWLEDKLIAIQKQDDITTHVSIVPHYCKEHTWVNIEKYWNSCPRCGAIKYIGN